MCLIKSYKNIKDNVESTICTIYRGFEKKIHIGCPMGGEQKVRQVCVDLCIQSVLHYVCVVYRGGNSQQFLAVQIFERCPDFHFISNRKSEQVVQKYVFTFSFFSKRKSGRPDFWKGVHIFVFDENQNVNTFPVQICTEKVFTFRFSSKTQM